MFDKWFVPIWRQILWEQWEYGSKKKIYKNKLDAFG